MSTSPSSAPSPSISNGCFDKASYYSSLPWFRRCLAMLNWRPVVDYELREIEFDRREIAHEQRMRQLRKENTRLAELNAKLSAILCSSATNSNQTNPMPNESEM